MKKHKLTSKKLTKKSKILLIPFLITLVLLGGGALFLFEPYKQNVEFIPSSYDINGQKVESFAYILQYHMFDSRDDTVDELAQVPFDLLIMESYFDETNFWTGEEVLDIQTKEHEKLCVAYLSIGEAEIYRPYWESSWDQDEDGVPDENAPDWLDIENPDWEGNFKVHYWEQSWQNLIFGDENAYLDQILAAGFDGVYLDIIDGYGYYEEQGQENAAELMVEFVGNISKYAKNQTADFLIIPQNAEELEEYPHYLEYVDGIGREEVLYQNHVKHPQEEVDSIVNHLQHFVDAGKFVLEVEYLIFPRSQRLVYEFADENNFLCYIGPRELHKFRTIWRFT